VSQHAEFSTCRQLYYNNNDGWNWFATKDKEKNNEEEQNARALADAVDGPVVERLCASGSASQRAR
jgi:hypothetical protein